MKQFKDERKPSPDGKVRIMYMGGSSHLADLEQVNGIANVLNCDPLTKDKFKIILAGWDSEGETTDIDYNKEFIEVLKKLKLLTKPNLKLLSKSKGNVDLIPKLPKSIADKFRDKVFEVKNRKITSKESIYFKYEMVLTDKHRIIKDKNYIDWLTALHDRGVYPNEDNYGRRWTQKANSYGSVLNEADIVIAPLDDNLFNRCKSNLKQVECWSRKLPIVCTDIPPYNIDGKNMENCVLIPPVLNSYKHWQKQMKKLVLDAELRTKLGEQLFVDFGEKYNLKTVTQKRVEFYKSICNPLFYAKVEKVENDKESV